MLDPKLMTPETLMANIALYSSVERTQPEHMDDDDRARYAALRQERQRRLDEARNTLPDGLYVSRAWAHEPHRSIMWRRLSGTWERVTARREFSEDDRPGLDSPETFYGLGWEKHIIALVAAED